MNNLVDSKKQEWCVTDLFRLTKSYEQIWGDHVIIEQMKNTLHEAKSDRYFYEMIQEAYFQCGIILQKNICRSYADYRHFFICRSSQFYWNEYGDLDKETIACMVHLLLTKRINLLGGVGFLLDNIEHEICNRVRNPFEKLYAAGKYRHDIDFGVCTKPFNNPVWENVDWFDIGLEDDYNIYDMEDGRDTPENYCERLAESIDEVMDFFDFQSEYEKLEALDRIGNYLHDDKGCTYTHCEFYSERPSKCTCDEKHLALEPAFYNPLRKKVVENMKQKIVQKNTKSSKKSVPSKNKHTSPIRLKDGVEIAEIERIIYALCKMKYFEVVGKEAKSTDKDVFKAFGDFFGVDFSNYHNNIKLQKTSLQKHLGIFTKMEEVIKKECNKDNEK